MFQIYAVIAGLLLPTGLISLIYFLFDIGLNEKKRPILWTPIFESFVTTSLGFFYLYCAVILSETNNASDAHFVNNIDDLAVTNDTSYDEIEIPTFYHKDVPMPPDQTNEVEDTRSDKNKPEPTGFLENYRHLVRTTVRKMLKNDTDEERTLHRARNLEPPIMDTLENRHCFLRAFFFQALMVHSFVSCALSLLNTCHSCRRRFTNENSSATREAKPENLSATFGEKILDDVSDDSSHNAAPVGPLFDEDSLGSATPNLNVFNIKKSTPVNVTTERACSGRAVDEKNEGTTFTVGRCLVMLTSPPLVVAVLYLVMKSGLESDPVLLDVGVSPYFNVTTSDVPAVHLAQTFSIYENGTGTHRQEVDDILRRVYLVIGKFEEEHKAPGNLPTVRGQYLYGRTSAKGNFTENCFGDQTNLKIFDFLVFVVSFFAVILYAKLTATQMPASIASRTVDTCIWVFLVSWTPGIIDNVVSMFIIDKGTNIFSGLLLLIGNTNRLYSTVQNVGTFKRHGKADVLIKPAFT